MRKSSQAVWESCAGFSGADVGELLHAAGAWMSEHPCAVLLSVGWVPDYLFPPSPD